MNACCGNCVWNDYEEGDYVCGNEDSECYGMMTSYDDWCTDYDPKEYYRL